MKSKNLKKMLILNLPYILIGAFATYLGEAWRLAEGANLSEKIQGMVLGGGFSAAFANPLPSLHLLDLLIGIIVGAILRLAVYLKGKNAKKYRHNVEYGSARWGTQADIEPFVDATFENNVLLSQSERITMNSISCCTVVDREDTKYLCELVQKEFPRVPLFLGGHEISHNFKDILIERVPRNYIPGIAGISIGLGQPHVGEILRYLVSSVKGEEYKYPKGFASVKDGEIIVSQVDTMDPNDYALFDYSLLQSVRISGREKPYDVYSFIGNTHAGNISELLKFNGELLSYYPIFTSYGCGNNCTFCDTDQYLLRYSVDNVKKMIEQFESLYGIDYIDFMDNNFAGGGIESRKICFSVLDYIHGKNIKIGFSNGLTFESMMRNDFELLRTFEKYGNVVHIAFPCENGNARVLRMIRKPHTVDMIKQTLLFAREHLPYVNKEGFFIGGFPETLGEEAETPDEVQNTVGLIRHVIQNNLLNQAIFLKLSPVTSMYREMWEKKHGDKSFVHCLFSKGTNIWPYDNSLLEDARIEVIEINRNENRFVTRKL